MQLHLSDFEKEHGWTRTGPADLAVQVPGSRPVFLLPDFL